MSMPGAPARPDHARGFTLVEVLVAFAVAAIVLVPLLRIFTTGLGALGTSERADVAALWAQSLLDARSGEAPLDVGTEGGDLAGGYRWQRTVTDYADAQMTAQLAPLVPYAVTMTVAWIERGRERAVTLQTLQLAPPRQIQAQ
jgi:general secretion pathway protein I